MTELAQTYFSGLSEIFGTDIPVGQRDEIDVVILRTYTYRLGHVEEPEGKYSVSVCRVQSGGNGEVLTPILDFLETAESSTQTSATDALDIHTPYPTSVGAFMRQLIQQARFIKTGRL